MQEKNECLIKNALLLASSALRAYCSFASLVEFGDEILDRVVDEKDELWMFLVSNLSPTYHCLYDSAISGSVGSNRVSEELISAELLAPSKCGDEDTRLMAADCLIVLFLTLKAMESVFNGQNDKNCEAEVGCGVDLLAHLRRAFGVEIVSAMAHLEEEWRVEGIRCGEVPCRLLLDMVDMYSQQDDVSVVSDS